MAIPCPFTLFSTDKIIHSCQIGWVFFSNLQSLQFFRDTVFRLNFSCVRNHVLQLLIALYVLPRLPDKMQNDKYNYLPGLKVKTLLNTPRPCYGNTNEMRVALPLGTGHATKSDEFSEKFQTAFDPPPSHFQKIILQIFYNGYGRIYASRYEGQIV